MIRVKATIRNRKSGEVYEWSGFEDHKPTPPELKVIGRKLLRGYLNFNFIRKDRMYDYEVLKTEVI